MQFYKTPDSLLQDLDQLEKDIAKFSEGQLEPVKFRAIRVAHGVYEQRKDATYMVRIRCPAGAITPNQFRRVAELAKEYGSNEVHFTTRQEMQLHYVRVENLMKTIRSLLELGLSTRGGGSNTVRNILTTEDSGIDPTEEFDVDPYATALTTRMLAEPDSLNLPRKFKINFSNSSDDKAMTSAACLGLVAKIKDGQRGFYVSCGGGMGAKSLLGETLFEWVPDTQVYHIAKAMKIMYDRYGSRRSRNTNRLRFLYAKLGREQFQEYFFEEYNKIKDDSSLALVLDDIRNEAKETSLEPIIDHSEEFKTWRKRYVKDQKQKGLCAIKVPLKLGDIESEEILEICDFVENFGENTIRCTRDQNMQLRNIPEKYLGNAFQLISKIDTLSNRPTFVGSITNCTGASTCKLGICLPRGVVSAISNHLIDTKVDLDQLADFKLKISGCPNTCGMHHTADLGLYGKVGRKNGKMYPSYVVLAGAYMHMDESRFAEKINEIPAKRVPEFVETFLGHYLERKSIYEDSYKAYLEMEGKDKINELCNKYNEEVSDFEQDSSAYIDFGAKKPLSLEEIGTAECSAGMFDMIDVDQKLIRLHQKRLKEETEVEKREEEASLILFSTCRMLLVTRGLDARSDEEIYGLFQKHFVEAGIVNSEFMDIVVLGKLNLKSEVVKHADKVNKLAEEVINLYKGMDDSLRFRTEQSKEDAKKAAEKADLPEGVDKFMDFRNVRCPLNFVKTKMALSPLKTGQKLQIFLDDGEPIQNVPNSVKLEGHKVLGLKQLAEGYWSVLIEKA